MKNFEKARLLWLVAGYAGWALIASLSLVPAESRPHTPVGGAYEHVLAYAAVGFCFGMGYLSMRRRVLTCLAVTVSTMIFEFLQKTQRRAGRWPDRAGVTATPKPLSSFACKLSIIGGIPEILD